MSPTYTHGRATHHNGPVCGADDGPVTIVTDDPHAVTCPDCPDTAPIEALPDDATAGDPCIIEILREVKRGQFSKIDGVVVDATTASAILAVYDAARPATRTKIAALPLTRMAALAWRLVRRTP